MPAFRPLFPYLTGLAFLLGGKLHAERPVNYNFEVKPILAEHCLKCHGQDEKQRKAKLRLDDRANAIEMKSVVPGKPEESELIKRILTHNEDEVMPPPDQKRPLSPAQVAILQRWIAEGATYDRHWSFIPPASPQIPEIRNPKSEIRNPIDSFVLAALEPRNIDPAKPAAREEWLRRVTFDLTGLPPTLGEIDEFLADTSELAFEKVTDRLLGRSTYGEHMAVSWLDVARYADTYGRHEDHDSPLWPYRDWVVRAFNTNLPYDKFVLWQTAGDMLPAATQDMYIATAFNRLPQQSNEAGSNEEEFRQDIIADRVRTNGIAFLGLSLECARCHDHKYDPITMRDYYSLAAFLNNIDECGLYTVYTDSIPAPSMFVYQDAAQERRHIALKLDLAMKEQQRAALLPAARERFHAAQPEHKIPAPLVRLDFEEIGMDKKLINSANPSKPAESRLKQKLAEGHLGHGFLMRGEDTVSTPGIGKRTRTQSFSLGLWLNPAHSTDRAVVAHYSRSGLDAGSRGYELLLENDRPSFGICHFWPGNAIRIRAKRPLPLHAWTHVHATYNGSSRASGMRMYVNGLPEDCEIVRDNLYKDITYDSMKWMKDGGVSIQLDIGGRYNDRSLVDARVDGVTFHDCELSPVEVRVMAGLDATDSSNDEWLQAWLRDQDGPWRKLTAEIQALRDEENDLSHELQELMVMRELPESRRRETHVLERGHFEARGSRVGPDVPPSVFPWPKDLPRTRLGYAQWLVDRRNPLTARVFVNRIWQQFFGRGIVTTSEDFGVQGQLPTHPELLDWLATTFMDNGWDVKALCRLIVLSGTYRQSSIPSAPDGLTSDPDNRLLARGPRMRLTAEELRDNALFVSGLLATTSGGKPAMPYQPPKLWEDSGTQHSYEQSHGRDLFRRSLYTFWRRTLPPPSMSVFDAPTREFCKSRREKSATPLQALVLFNDTQYIEAARILAEKLVREFPADDSARVQAAFRMLTSRHAGEPVTTTLAQLLRESRERFQASPQDASTLLHKNGESPVDETLNAAEVAATTLLVRALLAYDETVMKP